MDMVKDVASNAMHNFFPTGLFVFILAIRNSCLYILHVTSFTHNVELLASKSFIYLFIYFTFAT